MRNIRNKIPGRMISLVAMASLVTLYSSSVVYPQNNDLNRLIGSLKDQDPKARSNAAKALGVMKDARAVEPLIAALKDQDPKVRSSAARALATIEEARWMSAPFITTRQDTRLISALFIALIDEDSDVRQSTEWALRISSKWYTSHSYGNKSAFDLEPLIAALKDKPPKIRNRAAWALAKLEDPRGINLLNAAMKDKDLAIIAGASAFFIRKGNPGTEVLLIQALNKWGDSETAADFLNSGNSRLIAAGKKWAKEQGYEIWTMPFGSSSSWGSAK